MAAEAGHLPGRVYLGSDGALYLNGAAVYNADGHDVSGYLTTTTTTTTTSTTTTTGE